MSTLYDISKTHWDYIVQEIRAAVNSDRIPNVQDVRSSSDLWTQEVPAIGVQLVDAVIDETRTQRSLATYTFLIVLATQSTESTAAPSPPNMDDSNAQASAILSDGAGNGLIGLLYDPSMQTLGGLASLARVKRIDWQPMSKPSNDGSSEIWTEVYITFITQQFISV